MNNSYLAGFTLVELIITICLCSIFAGIALSDGVASYSRGLARADRINVLAALREVRDMALHGICTQPNCTTLSCHGIRLTSNELVLFEGPSYASRYTAADENIPLSGTRTISGADEIVFDAGTGNTLQEESFSMTGMDGRAEQISVSTDGTIDSNNESASSTWL